MEPIGQKTVQRDGQARIANAVRALKADDLRSVGNWREVESLAVRATLNSIDVIEDEILAREPNGFECLATAYITLEYSETLIPEAFEMHVVGIIDDLHVVIRSAVIDTSQISG